MPQSDLANFPFIQLAFAALTVIVTILLIYRGEKAKLNGNNAPQHRSFSNTEVYLGGPISQILTKLDRIGDELSRLNESDRVTGIIDQRRLDNAQGTLDEILRELRSLNHRIDDVLRRE